MLWENLMLLPKNVESSPPSVSLLPRKRGGLDISQHYKLPLANAIKILLSTFKNIELKCIDL
jgi:hypothetical protein